LIPVEDLGLSVSNRKGKGGKQEWTIVIEDSRVEDAVVKTQELLRVLTAFRDATLFSSKASDA